MQLTQQALEAQRRTLGEEHPREVGSLILIAPLPHPGWMLWGLEVGIGAVYEFSLMYSEGEGRPPLRNPGRNSALSRWII